MKKMILVVAVAFAAMSCGSKCDKKCCQEAEAAQQEQEQVAAPEEEQEELTPEEQEILKALQEAFEQAGLTE